MAVLARVWGNIPTIAERTQHQKNGFEVNVESV